jgi:hypothetical protein
MHLNLTLRYFLLNTNLKQAGEIVQKSILFIKPKTYLLHLVQQLLTLLSRFKLTFNRNVFYISNHKTKNYLNEKSHFTYNHYIINN